MRLLNTFFIVVGFVIFTSGCSSPLTIFPPSKNNAFQIEKAKIEGSFSIGHQGNHVDGKDNG